MGEKLTVSPARYDGEVLSPEAVLRLPVVHQVLRLVADGQVTVVDQVVLQPGCVAEPYDWLVPGGGVSAARTQQMRVGKRRLLLGGGGGCSQSHSKSSLPFLIFLFFLISSLSLKCHI